MLCIDVTQLRIGRRFKRRLRLRHRAYLRLLRRIHVTLLLCASLINLTLRDYPAYRDRTALAKTQEQDLPQAMTQAAR